MLKTVFIVMILKIKQYEKDTSATFGELKYGRYQGCGGLPSIASARSQLYSIGVGYSVVRGWTELTGGLHVRVVCHSPPTIDRAVFIHLR